MDALITMLRNVILFVALALPGFFLVKSGHLKPEQSGILSRLMLHVGMPFLIFSSVIAIEFDKEQLLAIGVTAFIGIVFMVIMFFMSKPLTTMEKNAKTRRIMQFCAVFANNGFLGIPLAEAVFPGNNQLLMVVIIINIITNVLMQTLGVYIVSGDKRLMNIKKALMNPLVITFVIGIAVNLTGLCGFVPEIAKFSDHFKSIGVPISMTILGMKLASVKFSSLFDSYRTYYISALRLVVFPSVITALLLVLNKIGVNAVSDDIVYGTFVAFAMPTAGLASTFADNFDGDTESAVTLTLGTTILSVISIPILYWLISVFLPIPV